MHNNYESYLNEHLKNLRLNLKHYRSRAGVTCEQLANHAKISSAYLSHLESEGSTAIPSLNTLCALASCLDIPVAELLACPEEEC